MEKREISLDEMIENMNKQAEEQIKKQSNRKQEVLLGDENQKTIILSDGTINEKYIAKMEEIDSLEELEQTNIPFSSFPVVIKNDILKKIVIGLLIIMTSIILKIAGYFTIPLVGVAFIISIILFYSAFIRFKVCCKNKIVRFEGIIVESKAMGVLKSNKYNVVKISNNEKFLNVKLSPNTSLKVGMPITLYINKSEPIIESDYGPLVENIISYSLSVESKEEREAFSNSEKISAEKYISNNQ